jgi:hypothetical protein
MPVIPATEEAEIRRITVERQPGQIVHRSYPEKNPSPKKKKKKKKGGAGGVAQGVGPEFKLWY